MKALSTTLNVLIGIFVATLLIGIVFKIMHWPGSGSMLITSKIAIGILYVARFWLEDKRSLIEYLKVGLVAIWASAGIIELFIEDPRDRLPFNAIAWGALIAWALTLGFEYLFQSKESQAKLTTPERVANRIYVLGAVTIIAGLCMTVLHLPTGAIVLAVGLSFGIIWIITQMNKKEDKGSD